jgi:hypothetical protein
MAHQFMHCVLHHFNLFFSDIHNKLTIVPSAVIKYGTFLADWLLTCLTEKFKNISFVSRTVNRFLCLILLVTLEYQWYLQLL